jgi:hypothetical protein
MSLRFADVSLLADNFAIGLLYEMAGYGVPTVVVPHCKP